MADFLTKAISAKQRWIYFFKFLNVVTTAAAQFSEEFEEQETQVKALKLQPRDYQDCGGQFGLYGNKGHAARTTWVV